MLHIMLIRIRHPGTGHNQCGCIAPLTYYVSGCTQSDMILKQCHCNDNAYSGVSVQFPGAAGGKVANTLLGHGVGSGNCNVAISLCAYAQDLEHDQCDYRKLKAKQQSTGHTSPDSIDSIHKQLPCSNTMSKRAFPGCSTSTSPGSSL